MACCEMETQIEMLPVMTTVVINAWQIFHFGKLESWSTPKEALAGTSVTWSESEGSQWLNVV